MASYPDDIEFTIKCRMRARWVPYFLGMLAHIQKLGSWGSSRDVTLFADGDGDFRPQFEWGETLPAPVNGIEDESGNTFFDAG